MDIDDYAEHQNSSGSISGKEKNLRVSVLGIAAKYYEKTGKLPTFHNSMESKMISDYFDESLTEGTCMPNMVLQIINSLT